MKKKVLIIEDQLSTRKLLKNYLSNSFDVIEMETASSALDWLKEQPMPDAIVSDIMMPGMTGIDFLSVVKGMKNVPPVIILSGMNNSTERIKCLTLGARDYMVKPFNPEELRIRLFSALA